MYTNLGECTHEIQWSSIWVAVPATSASVVRILDDVFSACASIIFSARALKEVRTMMVEVLCEQSRSQCDLHKSAAPAAAALLLYSRGAAIVQWVACSYPEQCGGHHKLDQSCTEMFAVTRATRVPLYDAAQSSETVHS